MSICEPGKISIGRRRTKCRFKKSRGFFWGRDLAECKGQVSTERKRWWPTAGPSRLSENFENPDRTPWSVDLWKGCDPEIEIVTNEPNPNFYPFNGVGIDDRSDYIRTFCENDARNRKFCTFACPNGVKMMFNGHTIPARKMKLKCRCPRVNGVKTCGWTYKRNLLTTGLDAYIYWRHTLVHF